MSFKSDWINLIPSGIEGRGRNGYFNLAHIYVSTSAVRGGVAFYSSRIGNSPPMSLTSDNPENLAAALRQTLDLLEGVSPASAKEIHDHAPLIQAAQLVIDRWEKGDLAEAVRNLDQALKEYKEVPDGDAI